MSDDRWLIRLSEVRPRPQGWLWPSRVPLAALTVLEGHPGEGKTLAEAACRDLLAELGVRADQFDWS